MKNLSLDGLIFEATKIDIKSNIMTITLNRPEKKNALNNVMMNEINYALAYAKHERSIRVICIAAEGDIFCAGADLSRTESESNVPKLDYADDISMSLRHLYKPVVCKIQGSVLAGALLIVTNSTHAIATKEATFSAPEIHRGLWPFMVMAGLFRVMPKRAGLDFIMRGKPIDSKKAQEWGLINEYVDRDCLDAYDKQDSKSFDEALPYLKEQIAECFKGKDAQEGIAAFLEKRKPNWDK